MSSPTVLGFVVGAFVTAALFARWIVESPDQLTVGDVCGIAVMSAIVGLFWPAVAFIYFCAEIVPRVGRIVIWRRKV